MSQLPFQQRWSEPATWRPVGIGDKRLVAAVGIEQPTPRGSERHPPGWCFITAGWRSVCERKGREWLVAPPPRLLRKHQKKALPGRIPLRPCLSDSSVNR